MTASLILQLIACQPEEPGERLCNGDAAICDRPLDEVAFAAAHNAMSNEEAGFGWPNQGLSLGHQLELGVRGMLLDTYAWNGGLWLCHGSCELGATPLTAGLRVLWDFLVQHPNEVLILVLQDGIGAEATAQAFTEAGLAPMAYAHPGGPWPTLSELIDAGTRLLVTTEGTVGPPDWIQDFYALGFDTPYDYGDASEFSCEVLRGDGGNDLFLLNHWITRVVPHPEDADVVNAEAVLLARAQECAAEHGRIPNLIAVDFADRGDLVAVVDILNSP